jgi:hypothetical protein
MITSNRIAKDREAVKPPIASQVGDNGASEAKPPSRMLRHVNAYYDPKSKNFWIPAANNRWTRVGTIRNYLIHVCGVDSKETGRYTIRIQQERSLAYAGPLAGRRPGIIETEHDGLVLVTQGFKLIEPIKGDWPFIKQLLEERMGRTQAIHFYVWLKLAYESLRDGKLRPGLFLAIVGPRDMHKTCTQELIITPILGGRQPGYPWHYFTRGTEFNGDFISAEHLIISDADAEKDDKKSPISDKVKQLCGTCTQRIHFKGRDAFTAEVFWRISESCNDEWPYLLTLPDLQDETVADKVLLLYFSGKPFGDWMPEDRARIQAKVQAELPAFIYYLVNMTIPTDCWSKRFGQVAYKNPIASRKYFAVTKEATLLDLIDVALFDNSNRGPVDHPHLTARKADEPWQGRVKDLEQELKDRGYGNQCEKMGAVGNTLGKMLRGIAREPFNKA